MPDPERAPLVRRAFEEYATGRFTKQQLLKQSRAWGLTNRRSRPLTSQAIGMPLRNQLYAGIVDVTEYGVRGKRGDFERAVLGGPLLPRARSCPGAYRAPHRSSARTRTSRCAPSCGASPVVEASRAACRRGRSSLRFEMALREGAARAGFHVALEADGSAFVGEFYDDVELPRASRCRMWTATIVVVGHARAAHWT